MEAPHCICDFALIHLRRNKKLAGVGNQDPHASGKSRTITPSAVTTASGSDGA